MHRLFLAAAIAVAPATVFAQTPRDNIDALIEQQAKANGVPASFVHAVVKRESNYNPRAKGGSALGLMQIKHATARSLGYTGDPAGLYDPETNLRYGVAYLAGAYRTAQGNLHQAYQYYNRGYYYAAKRQGIPSVVASTVAPVAASASALASLFSGKPPADAAPAAAMAYAAAEQPPVVEAVEVPLPPRRPAIFAGDAQVQLASLTTTDNATVATAQPSVTQASVATVEVPLPPRRPNGLGSAAPVQVADATPAVLAEMRLSPAAPAPAAAMAETTPAAQTETVAVPLPPRRPSPKLLAMAYAPRPAAAPAVVQEAVALPAQ